ncbi:unnamed protein product, partial [Phaeothamnion confervicola]
VPYSDFVGQVAGALGYPPPAGCGAPLWLWLLAVTAWRLLALLLRPFCALRLQPPGAAAAVAAARRFRVDDARARHTLGYAPLWTAAEAAALTFSDPPRPLCNPQARVRHAGPFPAGQVSRHAAEDDAWIVVDGKVFDVTAYVDQHPGGMAILRNAGGDSSAGMHGPQHPAQAMEILEEHYIAELESVAKS